MPNEYTISEQEKERMRAISPSILPLNPSAAGYSGPALRKLFTRFVFDDDEGLIKIFNDKMSNVVAKLDNYNFTYSGDAVKHLVKASSAVLKGQLLAVSGVSDGVITVEPASTTGVHDISIMPEYIIGIALTDISTGDLGYAVSDGCVIGVNTKNIPEGEFAYPDPSNPGSIISTYAASYSSPVRIGICIYSDEFLGALLVKTNFGGRSGVKEILTSDEYDDAIEKGIYVPDGTMIIKVQS